MVIESYCKLFVVTRLKPFLISERESIPVTLTGNVKILKLINKIKINNPLDVMYVRVGDKVYG